MEFLARSIYEGYVGCRAVNACAAFQASALDGVSLKNCSVAPVEATYVGDRTSISRYTVPEWCWEAICEMNR